LSQVAFNGDLAFLFGKGEEKMRKLIKIWIPAAILTLISVSSAQAALIKADWHSNGDNLIVRDTSTNLDWLMLTETNGMSYSHVITQLGVGGMFEGFRYASSAEVVSLFANNFSIDLSYGSVHSPNNIVDPGIELAATTLGNIANEWNAVYPFGVAGIVPEIHVSPFPMRQYIGAMDALNIYGYNIYWDAVEHGIQESHSQTYIGSYLVRPVPIPGAVWLLGSGLVGLLGLRKKFKKN
jgi:hypothetical protein